MTAEPADAAKILSEGIGDFKNIAERLQSPTYDTFSDAVKVRMRINGLSEEAALPLVKRAIVKVKSGYAWRADFRLRAPSLLRLTTEQVKNILSQIAIPTLVILGDKGMPQLRVVADRKAAKCFVGGVGPTRRRLVRGCEVRCAVAQSILSGSVTRGAFCLRGTTWSRARSATN